MHSLDVNFETIPEEKRKYFILGSGRSGSSFLCRILADAGATFDADHVDSWNPLAGAFEGTDLYQMSSLFARADHLRSEKQFSPLYKYFYKRIVTLDRSRAKRKMRRMFSVASYFKEGNLHHAVRPSARMGYWPVIVISCRSFNNWFGSKYPSQYHRTVEMQTENYVIPLRNALALLGTFGGCVVDYSKIMNLDEKLWAENLGKITGLDPDSILESRRKRFRTPGPETSLPVYSAEAEQIYSHVQEFAGKVALPSQAAVRRWLT